MSTNQLRSFGTASTTASFGVFIAEVPAPKKAANRSDIGAAVYSHIQAMRSLGRKTINTAEIAKALSLNVNEVDRAIVEMKGKGVKVLG
jgi:hypothetical protein